mmetsp:Transcript_27025/g.43700  ORF Transcript_27025/g.43700 Transcript_27025/m.43700 type:complete len:103 (+) Transcript_27025:133-441(+)
MEARYSEQIKALGLSLHEMATLHREAKRQNCEQKEQIETLREQLKVAKATNRKLTKDFVMQMRKATEISEAFSSTPVRHAETLAAALMSPEDPSLQRRLDDE